MGSNVKIWNGKEVMNVLTKRQMAGVNAERVEKSAVYQKTPSNEGKLFTNMRVNLSNDVQQDLINPEMADAFKENPYTQFKQLCLCLILFFLYYSNLLNALSLIIFSIFK